LNNTASGINSTALGFGSIAAGQNSVAIGNGCLASNDTAIAMGYSTFATGPESLSTGYNTQASGSFSFASGNNTTASGYASYYMGVQARSTNAGCFVWSDASAFTDFGTTASYQFLVLAIGGMGVGTNNPQAAMHVASGTTSAPQLQITQQATNSFSRLRMGVSTFPTWEIDVANTSTPALTFWNVSQRMSIDYNGNVAANSFTPSSDRNLKENFDAISPKEVLAKVVEMPISRWNFKEESGVRHLGPMAQDFRLAFGLGADDRHIATVDADGVALAAIQGLNQKLDEKDARIEKLEAQLLALQKSVEELGKK
jgi:hypothetical protein